MRRQLIAVRSSPGAAGSKKELGTFRRTYSRQAEVGLAEVKGRSNSKY